MTLNIDAATIQLTCPECGHQFDELIGKLKNSPPLTCPGCTRSILIEAEGLRQGIESADKALADFARSIKKL